MSAAEILSSLDRTLAEVRRTHDEELKALQDRLLAAEIELTMHKNLLVVANSDRDRYMRVCTKLISQFSTVEAVFADAKSLALQHATIESQDHTQITTTQKEESSK